MKENTRIATEMTKAQNENDAAKLLKLLAADFKSHISDVENPLSRDQYIEGVKMAHLAFSNLYFTIVDLIQEGDKVVVRIIARGKHTGKYMEIAPTNRQVEFSGIAIRRIVDGKVTEEWQVNDQKKLLEQLM